MSQLRKITVARVLFLALLAIVASPRLLNAVDYTGKFTLPGQVIWDKAILPAGEYTFTLNISAHPYRAKVEGNGVAVYVLASGWTDSPKGEQSSLIILRRGGKGIIRSLFLADQGRVFTYNLPKGELPVMAKEPLLIQRVPIVFYGK